MDLENVELLGYEFAMVRDYRVLIPQCLESSRKFGTFTKLQGRDNAKPEIPGRIQNLEAPPAP